MNMRKIYTKSVFEYDKNQKKYVVNESESEFHLVPHDSPISLMKSDDASLNEIVRPYLQGAYQRAGAFKDPPNTIVAPLPGDTISWFTNARDRVFNPDATEKAGESQLQRTLGGDYSYGGEGFNAALDAAKNKIIPNVQSQFAKGGRTGSGLAATAEAGAIGDAFAGLYDKERQRQIAASQLVPEFERQKAADLDAFRQSGNFQQQFTQTTMDAPRQWADDYLKLLQGGAAGGVGSAGSVSPWARYLMSTAGGAAGGFASGGPVGGAVGGGLGLLNAYLNS